jgi:hypothetical protein
MWTTELLGIRSVKSTKENMERKEVTGGKTTQPKTNGASKTASAGEPAASEEVSTSPAEPVAAKAAATTKAKKTKAAPKARSARPAASRNPAARTTSKPSTDEIQLRAYFIAQRRQMEGRGGDPAQDWFDAERELLAEARKRPGKI